MKKNMFFMLVISLLVNVVCANIDGVDSVHSPRLLPENSLQTKSSLRAQGDQTQVGSVSVREQENRNLSLQQYAQQQRIDFSAQEKPDLSLDSSTGQVFESQAKPVVSDFSVENTTNRQALPSQIESLHAEPMMSDVQVKSVVPAIIKPIARKAQKASVDQN
jgi:hypothetical protein